MLAPAPQPVSQHVQGLDALRFAAAAWVALSHGARLPLDQMIAAAAAERGDAPSALHGWAQAFASLNNGLFNGVAAVMVFFVISGFVIHLPQTGGARLDPINHWVRRLARILPPLIVATALVSLLDQEQVSAFRGVLWSVWCEIAYYVMYPALLPAFRRFGVAFCFAVATAASCAAILWTWPASYHSQLSWASAAVIGAPSWILGCLLAERVASSRGAEVVSIWPWRFAALALSAIMKAPVTHGPWLIGYPASHWLFAIFAFFWIEREIARFRARPPLAGLEALGAASYSLYLVHMPVIVAFRAMGADRFSQSLVLGEALRWGATLIGVAVATYAFYRLVEAPTHRLARALGRMARSPRGLRPAT
jgi:peptidoglycan/LPS O-acetylase OafA/YrhL